jgi:LacI family transcriptional regulator
MEKGRGARAKRVRIRDVAAAAGVSATTTSFVLNGQDASISQETRDRVREVARKLGYRPHASARALATGRTHRMGVVLNTPYSLLGRGTYHTQVLAGIMSAGPRTNYNLLIHSADYPDWETLYDDILSGMADGVLLIGRQTPDPLTDALLKEEFPLVCISYNVDHPDCYSVDCDNERGGYIATEHLLSLGHRHILALSNLDDSNLDENSWQRERCRGAARAIQDAGLSPEHLTIWEPEGPDLTPDTYAAAVAAYLDRLTPSPTALIGYDESGAQWLVEHLPTFGRRVPDDVAVVSFNSTTISERSRPPLTSVWQPLDDIGAAAVEMLAARIEGRDVPERILRFPVRLDVRASTVAR